MQKGAKVLSYFILHLRKTYIQYGIVSYLQLKSLYQWQMSSLFCSMSPVAAKTVVQWLLEERGQNLLLREPISDYFCCSFAYRSVYCPIAGQDINNEVGRLAAWSE